MRHKGQRIDRRKKEGCFPFWVALKASLCSGENYARLRGFCYYSYLSRSSHGHSVFYEGEWYVVLRFAEIVRARPVKAAKDAV